MRASSFLLALAACVLVSVARAEPHDPVAAEGLFRDGRAAAQRGDWETACPKLRESQRLDPAPGTLLNLADCEEHRGKLATAWQLFRQVIDALPASDERVPLARERGAALERRMPRLTVRVAGPALAGLKVLRNDLELGEAALGSALPVDPGVYRITVTAPGTTPQTSEVVVAESTNPVVEVHPGAPLSEPQKPLLPARGDERSRAPAFVAGAVGLAGLSVGTVAGLLTLSRKNTVDDNCRSDSKACNQTGYDAAQSGKTLGVVTTAGLLVGVLGIGAGAYLLLSESSDHSSTAVSAQLFGGPSVALEHRW